MTFGAFHLVFPRSFPQRTTMITVLAALALLQTAPTQYHVGIALAPGDQVGPVARVSHALRIMPHFSFQLEAGLGFAGSAGINSGCDLNQCYYRDVEHHALELEVPTLFAFSVGPRGSLFFTAGPVFALRFPCRGAAGGVRQNFCENGSQLAWGTSVGVGFRATSGTRPVTVEARLQRFETPLVKMSACNCGAPQAFKAQAVTVAVGWGKR